MYKGYGLSKEAEEYLASHGLKSSSYSVSASDVKSDLFGKIVPCLLQVNCSMLDDPFSWLELLRTV